MEFDFRVTSDGDANDLLRYESVDRTVQTRGMTPCRSLRPQHASGHAAKHPRRCGDERLPRPAAQAAAHMRKISPTIPAEMARHEQIPALSGVPVFFCNPYGPGAARYQ
jgi:hypothetical protein